MEGVFSPVDDPDAYVPMAQDGDGDDVPETQCVSAMTSSTSETAPASVPLLPYPYHWEEYHLLIDRDYATSWSLGTAPPWSYDSSYEVPPLDPLIWPGGAIPFKKVLVSEAGEIVKNCPVAAMYYAMAVRAEHATGPPVMLLTLRITLGGQAKAILRGTMKVANDRHTLLFTKPPLAENYPGFIETEQYNFSDEEGKALLEYGKALLNMDVKLPGVNLAVAKTTAERAACWDEEQRGAKRSSDGQADGAPPAAAMGVSQEPANSSGDPGPLLESIYWTPDGFQVVHRRQDP